MRIVRGTDIPEALHRDLVFRVQLSSGENIHTGTGPAIAIGQRPKVNRQIRAEPVDAVNRRTFSIGQSSTVVKRPSRMFLLTESPFAAALLLVEP